MDLRKLFWVLFMILGAISAGSFFGRVLVDLPRLFYAPVNGWDGPSLWWLIGGLIAALVGLSKWSHEELRGHP